MKSCIRIPRVTLPRDDFETWAIPPIDRLTKGAWEELARIAGEKPSLLGCTVPDLFLDGEDEERLSLMQKFSCLHLCQNSFERLYRGAIYVERETSTGLRQGIVANLDLEAMEGRDSPVRLTSETSEEIVFRRMKVREESMLEFPHTILFYRDKRDKVVRAVGEDRELLYDFSLPLGGGNVKGYFIPDMDAIPLMRELLSRADFFYVADGNHSLAAAKRYWDKIKEPLSEEERENHPARFTLVEFVNEIQDGIFFCPGGRVVKEIETEAFCDFFSKKIKCRREKNLLSPEFATPESFCEAEEVIREFLKHNYGKMECTFESPRAYVNREDCAFVDFPEFGKEELFSAAKSGKKFPAKSFCFGATETDARYSFEGREITYD